MGNKTSHSEMESTAFVASWVAQPPLRITVSSADALYVAQGEWAMAQTGGRVDVLGSDDATTCHIVALLDRRLCSAGNPVDSEVVAVAVAHCDDESTASQALDAMHSALQSQRQSQPDKGQHQSIIEAYVAGGLAKDTCSTKLSNAIRKKLRELRCKIILMATCQHNATTACPPVSPAVRGLAVRLSTGEVQPASYDDDARGPERELRSARFLSTHPVPPACCYDAASDCVIIEPFQWDPEPFGTPCRAMMEIHDSVLLSELSTSPQQELPRFVPDLKALFEYFAENPHSEAVFQGKAKVVTRIAA